MIINSDFGHGGFVLQEREDAQKNIRRFVSRQKAGNGRPKYSATFVIGDDPARRRIVVRRYEQIKVEWRLRVIFDGEITNTPVALTALFRELGIIEGPLKHQSIHPDK